jgi:hypothetical protein
MIKMNFDVRGWGNKGTKYIGHVIDDSVMTKNDFKRSYNGKESNIDIEKYQNNRFYFDESIKLSFSKIKEVLKPFRRHEDGFEGIIYRTL